MNECIEFKLTPFEEFMNSVDVDVECVDEFTEIIQEGKILDEALGKGNDEATWKKVAKFIPRLIRAVIKKLGDIISKLKIVQKLIAKSGKGVYINTEVYDSIIKYLDRWDEISKEIKPALQRYCDDIIAGKKIQKHVFELNAYIDFPDHQKGYRLFDRVDPATSTVNKKRQIISQTKAIAITTDIVKRVMKIYDESFNEEFVNDLIKTYCSKRDAISPKDNYKDWNLYNDLCSGVYFNMRFCFKQELFETYLCCGHITYDLMNILKETNGDVAAIESLRNDIKGYGNKDYYDPIERE
jgi:hypothetical protein